MATLLAEPRIARLVEQEAVDGAAAYRPTEFFADLRRGSLAGDRRGLRADRSVPAEPAARVSRRDGRQGEPDVRRVAATGARRAAGARCRRARRDCQGRRSHHAPASAGRARSDRADSRSEVRADGARRRPRRSSSASTNRSAAGSTTRFASSAERRNLRRGVLTRLILSTIHTGRIAIPTNSSRPRCFRPGA